MDVDDSLIDSIHKRRLSYTLDHLVKYPFLLEITEDMKDGDYYVYGNIESIANWNYNIALKFNRVIINDKIFYGYELPIKQNQFPFENKCFKNKSDDSIHW